MDLQRPHHSTTYRGRLRDGLVQLTDFAWRTGQESPVYFGRRPRAMCDLLVDFVQRGRRAQQNSFKTVTRLASSQEPPTFQCETGNTGAQARAAALHHGAMIYMAHPRFFMVSWCFGALFAKSGCQQLRSIGTAGSENNLAVLTTFLCWRNATESPKQGRNCRRRSITAMALATREYF